MYRGVPYPRPEEVFLRCNTAEADDDNFGDIGRSDAIQAFRVSGKHRAQRRRGNLSQYERGLLDHTLRDWGGDEPRDSVLEISLGATGAMGAAVFDRSVQMEEKVRSLLLITAFGNC